MQFAYFLVPWVNKYMIMVCWFCMYVFLRKPLFKHKLLYGIFGKVVDLRLLSLLMVAVCRKTFVHKVADSRQLLSVAQQLWEGVRKNDKKTVYRLIVVYQADVNSVYTQASVGTSFSCDILILHWHTNPDYNFNFLGSDCSSSLNPQSGSEDHCSDEFLDGCSLLHLACQTADIGMVELLLQHGANINACDSRGQIPLHHSFLRGRTEIAKLLLSRYFLGSTTSANPFFLLIIYSVW